MRDFILIPGKISGIWMCGTVSKRLGINLNYKPLTHLQRSQYNTMKVTNHWPFQPDIQPNKWIATNSTGTVAAMVSILAKIWPWSLDPGLKLLDSYGGVSHQQQTGPLETNHVIIPGSYTLLKYLIGNLRPKPSPYALHRRKQRA